MQVPTFSFIDGVSAVCRAPWPGLFSEGLQAGLCRRPPRCLRSGRLFPGVGFVRFPVGSSRSAPTTSPWARSWKVRNVQNRGRSKSL